MTSRGTGTQARPTRVRVDRLKQLMDEVRVKPARKANPETRIVAAVREAATSCGIRCWRTNPAAAARLDKHTGQVRYMRGLSTPGVADLIGLCPGGRFFACEVKAADGKLRPEQSLFLDDVTNMGGIALVARSVGDIGKLHEQVRAGTWYGVASPFRLTRDQRLAAERAVAKKALARAAKRS